MKSKRTSLVLSFFYFIFISIVLYIMNKHEGVVFLFSIAKEIKRSFENPVILMTLKDYSDCVFNSLVDMRTALLHSAAPERTAELIKRFHIEWLQAIQDVEIFKRKINNTPREMILRAIDYSIRCVENRYKYFQKYIEQLYSIMSEDEMHIMKEEIKSIQDLCSIVTCALHEKRRCLSYQSDQSEFYVLVTDEVENLMNWLDRLNDFLALEYSKILDLHISHLPNELTNTLQNLIDEVAIYFTEKEKNGQEIHSKARVDNYVHMRKIDNKIKILKNRINQMKTNESSELLALQHKTIYLEEKLQSLDNLRTSLNLLIARHRERSNDDDTMKNKEIHIFNHMLPRKHRCRLVDQLIKLWDVAIRGHRNGKIISILSVTDFKETFYDDLGQFTVDKHGRKIYTIEGDKTLYQSNEENQLVALQDDEKHVYYFDECGRYYLNETRDRVYKSHNNASEYTLHRAGIVLKVKEDENGIEYRYDSLGRYYVNEYGKQIYHDQDSTTEYEHDGFGNLVRLSDCNKRLKYVACSKEQMVTEESKYLKKTVGAALKICLADVVLTQPSNPIEYLANCLEKYRYNIEARRQRLVKNKEIMIERELYTAALQTTPLHSYIDVEESIDYNFTNYEN